MTTLGGHFNVNPTCPRGVPLQIRVTRCRFHAASLPAESGGPFCDLALVRPAAAKVSGAASDDGSRIAENEELGSRTFGNPGAVVIDDCRHIRWLALDRDLPRPDQRGKPRRWL